MARRLEDYDFKDGVLRLIPLDRKESSPTNDWIKAHSDRNEWDLIQIEGIEFIGLAGTGANGIVLKGRQLTINRLCAIKFWMPHHKNARKYNISNHQYKEEIKKLGVFSNNRIVSIHDARETAEGSHPFSIMEWIEGETLEEWLDGNQHASISVRTDILSKMMEVVQYCHSQGVYHGDLHHRNIMITGQYHSAYDVKLLDFGTSLFSRKNNPDKTKQRESKLLLQTALSLVEEADSYNFLLLGHGGADEGNYINVELCKPELVVLTIKSLAQIIYILEVGAPTSDALSDIAEAISHAPYLNIASIINFVAGYLKDDKTDDFERLFRYFLGCLANYYNDKLVEQMDVPGLDSNIAMLYVLHECAVGMDIEWIADVDQLVKNEQSRRVLTDLANTGNAVEWIENLLVPSNSFSYANSALGMARAYFDQYIRLQAKKRNMVEPVIRYYINSKLIEEMSDSSIREVLANYSDALYSLEGKREGSKAFREDQIHLLNMKI